MNKHVVFAGSLLIACALIILLAYTKYQNQVKDTVSFSQEQGPVDLIPTKEEIAALEKWKDKFIEEWFEDSFSGDRAGLYMFGMSYLLGNKNLEITIDVNQANYYFAKSASLGFPPALDKIRSMYIEDYPNFWLTMVYVNLTISAGHHEFAKGYYKLRADTIEKCGQEAGSILFREVERIALQKQKLILENQKNLAKAADKQKFILGMPLITDRDRFFDSNYWAKIYEQNK